MAAGIATGVHCEIWCKLGVHVTPVFLVIGVNFLSAKTFCATSIEDKSGVNIHFIA